MVAAYQEISLAQMAGVVLGNAADAAQSTGVTALIFPEGARVGIDISGGGPASRETPLLSPTTAATPVNAIVFAGGSAYGLAAADGVMRCLEEHGIGYDTGFARVPIVCQSDIYDLAYGSAAVRPDAAMGYAACQTAFEQPAAESCGSVGAGTGATVGKLCGMARSMKSGMGSYAVRLGRLQLAAVVVVNALGDIFAADTGEQLAGLLNEERTAFADSRQELYKINVPQDMFNQMNTTVGAIVTNGDFDKAGLTKLASMARNAYARCINPVGTLADGDTIYAAACGAGIPADLNVAGTLAAEAMAEAIRRAVVSARVDDDAYLPYCLAMGARH